jgi:exonuclease SbcC
LPASETQPRWASLAAADKAWGDAKTELASKNATLNNRQKDIQGAETELSKVRWDVAARLSQSPFAAIEDLKAARLEPAQAERLETIDTGLRERSNSLEADLKAARESIAKWRKEAAPEPEALAEVKTRHAALQLQHEQLIKDSTTWKNQLTNDEKNRLVVAEKQREIDACRRRLEVWRKLRGLIGSHDGRTFRRYAQGISLDVLVLRANRHLARLSDRYRMRRGAGEELDLEIEDLHQAGAVRPMASLSGGESFLASLALALGLSDIAGRNVRIESLFVDEGFGSLDSEALDVAISALETLRQDSKTVGVISHVDLLKERIAAQIIVEKQSGGTSVLRIG